MIEEQVQMQATDLFFGFFYTQTTTATPQRGEERSLEGQGIRMPVNACWSALLGSSQSATHEETTIYATHATTANLEI